MNSNYEQQTLIRTHVRLPVLLFYLLVIIGFTSACDAQPNQTEIPEELSDPNARMYQMYFDSSSDPAQNVLQVRKFIGQLHMTDIEGIFGDIQSLARDENCNFTGGPVLDDGLIWYVTLTADQVGANLISVSPDGTKSSAFDLDGDRIVDILDIGLLDDRRFTILSELNGLDVAKLWLQGQNPFCSSELIQEIKLPALGCNETGDGESGAEGFYPGTGIVDPMGLLCSEYDTSPWAGIMDGSSRARGCIHCKVETQQASYIMENRYGPDYVRHVTTNTVTNSDTGEVTHITKTIHTYDLGTNPPHLSSIQIENVDSDGHGRRVYTTYDAEGHVEQTGEIDFEVDPEDVGQANYSSEDTSPPAVGCWGNCEPNKSNPGPEGDDANVAEFCQRRANYRSGLEQAAGEDPTSMSVSCNDLVGDPDMPDDPNCTIVQYAGPEDFMGVLDPPSSDGGCDPNDNPDQMCEPESIGDRIRRVRGRTAELWSLDVPDSKLCPPSVCDPALAAENRTYTAGEVEFACEVITDEVITEPPTLEPSAENCPPGTYYAPVTNRCIEIQILPKKGGGGEGGSAGGCNLSAGACGGFPFDADSCSCVGPF